MKTIPSIVLSSIPQHEAAAAPQHEAAAAPGMSAGCPSGLPLPARAGTSGCRRSSQGGRAGSRKPAAVAPTTSLQQQQQRQPVPADRVCKVCPSRAAALVLLPCMCCYHLCPQHVRPMQLSVHLLELAHSSCASLLCRHAAATVTCTASVCVVIVAKPTAGPAMTQRRTRVSRASPPRWRCQQPGAACLCSA